MTLSKFSRLCEVLEKQKPTKKRQTLSENLSSFSDGELLVRILCEEYESNNIGEKTARKWIATSFGIFDEEVTEAERTWSDIGEGMNQFIGLDKEDSDISLKTLMSLLTMVCA